jgi:hypothetical protein
MSTKPSLSALMKRAAHGPAPEAEAPAPVLAPVAPAPAIALVAPTPVVATAPVAAPPPIPVAPIKAIEMRSSGRNGKKPLSVWVTPEARRTLRQLAAEQDRTIESLIGEGLNDLFQKYQKPRLA